MSGLLGRCAWVVRLNPMVMGSSQGREFTVTPLARACAVAFMAALLSIGCSSGGIKAATTTTTAATSDSAAVVAADQVRACTSTHHMATAHEVTTTGARHVFGFCDWPPPHGADQAGYSEVVVVTRTGPGQSEASDSNLADYIDSTCGTLNLQYSFGSQGAYHSLPAFVIHAGTVVSEDDPGHAWTGAAPYPYPSPTEVVYLHNSNQSIVDAHCIG